MECFAVSSGSDESTFIWNVGNLTVHHNVKANGASLNGSCLLGGQILVSSQASRPAVHVYSLGSSESPLKCPMPEKLCLTCSRDGSFLFGGGKSGKIYVWALGSGVLLNVFEAHFREVTCLSVTSDGACLVSGGDDGVVHAWMVSALVDSSVAARKPVALHTWTGHGLKISALHCALGPFGETVVLSASLDATVKMWRLGDGALVADVAFPGAVTCLALDIFEEYLFAGCVDGSVFCVNFKHNSVERQMAVSEIDGDEAALKKSFRSVLSAHTGEVTVLCVGNIGAGNRQVLISGSKDGVVHVWDIQSGELVSSFKKHVGAAVQSVNLFWAPSGCALDEEPRVVVGKLQKFPAESASALSWHTMPKRIRVLESASVFVEPRPQPLQQHHQELNNQLNPDLEARVHQLEAENAELHAANKHLYELKIEQVLTNKQKGLKAKSRRKKKVRADE